jgi:tryptophan synthase alpha chain
VDILELGVPFSDPEAEGPAIQASSERALANGVTMLKVLDAVKTFRQQDTITPVVLMGYLNSLLARPDFAKAAQQAGVDGVIMVNLPPEAAADIQADLNAHDIDLIYLVAPTTTDERARLILARASGFMYYVSLKGITGADHLQTTEVSKRLRELRGISDLPMCVGFGIKDAATAASVAEFADGVVVGSALVNLLAQHPGDVQGGAEALRLAATALRKGVDEAG